MRAVRVHLHDGVVAPDQCCLEARDIRGPKACLGGTVEHMDVLVGGSELVGDLPGPVGAVVIDDEQVRADDRGPHTGRDETYIISLVIGGNYHGHATGECDCFGHASCHFLEKRAQIGTLKSYPTGGMRPSPRLTILRLYGALCRPRVLIRQVALCKRTRCGCRPRPAPAARGGPEGLHSQPVCITLSEPRSSAETPFRGLGDRVEPTPRPELGQD